jgi:hypothetical protein
VKDRLVYLVFAECRLILPEAQAPQPEHDIAIKTQMPNTDPTKGHKQSRAKRGIESL